MGAKGQMGRPPVDSEDVHVRLRRSALDGHRRVDSVAARAAPFAPGSYPSHTVAGAGPAGRRRFDRRRRPQREQ
jgi:hypothetical protein